MKKSVKGIVTSVSAIVLLGGASAFASTWTTGTVTVPHFGGGARTSQANVKRSNSTLASFHGTVTPNSFGYYVKLVNSDSSARSSRISLPLKSTSHAKNNSGTIGYNYYAYVNSKVLEPSVSYVKLNFSADNK